MNRTYEETQEINKLWMEALDKAVPFTVRELANVIHRLSYQTEGRRT